MKPSTLRALFPLKLDKVTKTSSSENGISNASDSTIDKESKFNPLMLGLQSPDSTRILLKAFATPTLMLS